MTGIEIRHTGDRFHTSGDGIDSWQSFSYGRHFDPQNTHFGVLLANNHDTLQPGAGYDRHRHRDVEIVTWVLSGELSHEDSGGNSGVVASGNIQRLSAGRGVEHSERNRGSDPVSYVQMWITPDRIGGAPDHAVSTGELRSNRWVALASGHERGAAVSLRQRAATLWACRLDAGSQLMVPDGPLVHLYVARGSITFDVRPPSSGGAHPPAVGGAHPPAVGGALGAGSAVRLDDASACSVAAVSDCELLAWSMQPSVHTANQHTTQRQSAASPER